MAESVDRDLAWRPFAISGDGELALCRLNVHRVGLQVFGQAARLMPIGWTGSEPQTRTTVAVGTKQQLGDTTREVISIHPPWSEGRVGTGWIEYPLELPAEQPILLRFSNAVTATGTGDGVTFRVRVARFDVAEDELGEVVFDRHSADKEWLAGEVDLSRFAGQTIRLQLESHPGPKSNTAFDQSYWAEPILVVGKPSVDRPFPPRNSDDALSLGALSNGDRHTDVRVWPGQRGLLDADVGLL